MKSLKIEVDWEVARELVIKYLEDDLKFWAGRRNLSEEEKEFRKGYIAALKVILEFIK